MKNMNIFQRWKAPTPLFFKKTIRVCLTVAAGTVALLIAETIGKAIVPGFTFTLHPFAVLVAKNLLVAAIVGAGIAKAAVQPDNNTFEKPAAPKDESL
jgi:hypothetical protein